MYLQKNAGMALSKCDYIYIHINALKYLMRHSVVTRDQWRLSGLPIVIS